MAMVGDHNMRAFCLDRWIGGCGMSTTALFEHAPFAECRQLDLGNPTGSGYLICLHVGSTDP